MVSVLFADVVGFTTISEHRDPEEVRELLSHYFERCRTLIERHGGTVEKFIGDAVMAVWGTPVAREDDAERAVRAALALTQAVTALGDDVGSPGLRVRAGVLTGRAAVDVGAEAEGMVLGDTVNTASRLQSIAPPGAVLVDDVTRRASEAAIAYEDGGIHQVKGREQPVHAWTALRVVAGAGGARRGVGLEAPFVGRQAELRAIIDLSEQSAGEGRARHLAVVGDAGSGKSRLLWEFFKYIDGIEEVRWWHQGRCLSYGEGVSYWALTEMIRARAGIMEEEPPDSAREKLRAAIEEHVADERERRLVEPRLAQLLGLEQGAATEAADLFSGWRLFFERMAATKPVILVFEDLQWADSGLLDFIDYLLEWSADFPIFILALGRSELEARRPGWGTVAHLRPLDSATMQALLAGLVPGLPRDLTARILERAEGIPLYAVETVRMLLDRGLVALDGNRYVVTGDIADLEIPETLQALVAARLDNLDPTERALLQDAAVLGTSFSLEALTAVSRCGATDVRRALDTLVAKQVLGRDEDHRLAEPGQFQFLQALLRTVALGTLSRRDRKARHLAAADYLRSAWGEATEIAEVLASHYLDAVAADPAAADVGAIRALARETLVTAGHRAGSLALAAEARRYFEDAAGLADEEAERARLLAEAGAAAARTADRDGARELLGDAITVLDATGRTGDAARTRALMADVLIADNRLQDAAALIDRARQSITDETVLAELAARRARVAALTGDFPRAREEAETALSIADPRHLVAVLADAALTKAHAFHHAGRLTEGDALMSLGLELALEGELIDQALRGFYNLAEFRFSTGRLEDADVLIGRGLALARERGDRSWERDLVSKRIQLCASLGRWDSVLTDGDALREVAEDEAERVTWALRPLILVARGETAGLQTWLRRPMPDTEWREQALIEAAARAAALRATGFGNDAVMLVANDVAEMFQTYSVAMAYFGEIVDTLLHSSREATLEKALAAIVGTKWPVIAGQRLWARALLQIRRGDLAGAEAALAQSATALRTAGNPFALARVLLDHGTVLKQLGREPEAASSLDEARSLFAELAATPWCVRVDSTLAPVAAA